MESISAAANRFYYAVFHAIHALFVTIGIQSKSHNGTIAQFNQQFIKTGLIEPKYGHFVAVMENMRYNDSGNTHYDCRNNCNAIIETATNVLVQGCTTTVIPENITGIGNYAFAYFGSIKEIEIPESVTRIGTRAFLWCNLKKITNHAVVPQVFESDAFNEDKSACTLYVPAASVEAYKSADIWKEFNPILPIGSQAIDNISENKPKRRNKIFSDGQILILRGGKVYTLQGQEMR